MGRKTEGSSGVRGLFWVLPFLVTIILLAIGLITREHKLPIPAQKNILVLEEEVTTNRAEVFSAEVNKKEEVLSNRESGTVAMVHVDLNVMREQLKKKIQQEKKGKR